MGKRRSNRKNKLKRQEAWLKRAEEIERDVAGLPPEVLCPACDGSGWVTTEHADQIRENGHHA